MSDSLRPHGLQHARPPCPSPTPGILSNSCPLSQWCHATIPSCVVLFSSQLQSFPASGSFQMSQLFTSGGQSIGVSASTSVLPMNIQDWFYLGLTGWISLQSKGFSRVFYNTSVQKHPFFGAFFTVQLSHPYMTTGKTIALTRWTFVGKIISLFFSFIFINRGLIILQYCSGFCHTLTWISHGFTCVPHPEPCSHLPPHPIPLGYSSVSALSACLMHPVF